MFRPERKIRIALPSKGMLSEGSLRLFDEIGLPVYNPNPRQYIAWIHRLPEVEVIFQRPGDIVTSVRDGSVDFGITGRDLFIERGNKNERILALHQNLGFAKCTLNVIVPDEWQSVERLDDLAAVQKEMARPLKIATKFPNTARDYFSSTMDIPFEIIQAEGALEIAPTVGYADLIVDLVSTGTTLRDNRLKRLEDGKILDAEACLIANKARLRSSEATLATASLLLEMICAHFRGKRNLAVFANIRADSEEELTERLQGQDVIAGLQGPTISRVLAKDESNLFAIHIVVSRNDLYKAVSELRTIGGSGVVVSPVDFIFEEQPQEVLNMYKALED
ncbi:ATP phosphoribosyltransferase [bacterium]|nr:ATP phosphoribosyltransferase [bacterium]